MKCLIVAFCFSALIVFFNGCKKEAAVQDVAAANTIVGTWELRQAQTSMMPTVSYPPGNGTVLRFGEATYERYAAGNLIENGHYSVVTDTTVADETGLVIPAGQFEKRIVFGSASSQKTFMELSGNKLVLLSGYFPLDGGARLTYERKVENP